MRVPPAFLNVAGVALDDVGLLDLADVVEHVAELDLQKPTSSGLCGSPSSSVNAWCLRWTATHSFVGCPVVSHSENLNIHSTAGCSDERFVRGAAMEIDGRAEHGHLGDDGRDDERTGRSETSTTLPPKIQSWVNRIPRGKTVGVNTGSSTEAVLPISATVIRYPRFARIPA